MVDINTDLKLVIQLSLYSYINHKLCNIFFPLFSNSTLVTNEHVPHHKGDI